MTPGSLSRRLDTTEVNGEAGTQNCQRGANGNGENGEDGRDDENEDDVDGDDDDEVSGPIIIMSCKPHILPALPPRLATLLPPAHSLHSTRVGLSPGVGRRFGVSSNTSTCTVTDCAQTSPGRWRTNSPSSTLSPCTSGRPP
jgi:hypothetical protein